MLFVSPAALAASDGGPRSGRWAHEGTRETPDSRVTWGRLDNGFRYALLPHRAVPGRVALQLVVLAGSLDERDNELGIAHFLEHMAFGGSRNFKAEDMVSLFQRLGVEYGSDVNATTTFDYTAYRLDFRENSEALLREGLLLFRGFGDGLTFDPAIIERERRVVRAELRNRNTITEREHLASMPVLFRGLHFPQRSAGGKEELIAKFTREDFLEFYRRNYRPDLMVLVGTGDFDPAVMAAMISDMFGDMVRPREPVPPRNEGRLDARGLRAGVFRVDGMPSASTQVASVFALDARGGWREQQAERQKRRLVMDAFGARVKTQIPIGLGAEAGYDELLGHGIATASMGVPAGQWSEGVQWLDQMVRLTLERGLDPTDVEDVRRKEMRATTTMIDQLPTLDPGMLCDLLTDSITTHAVFGGLEDRLAWTREWLEKFTPAEAHRVFRDLWAPGSMAFHVSGGVNIELSANRVIEEVQKIRRTGLANVMPRLRRETPFSMPRFGQPTEVVERREVSELGAHLLRFGNNVRLNFAPNRHEPGLVHAVVRVGAGLLDMPGNKPALKEFGLNTLLGSGGVRFRSQQLQALVRDRLLEFSFDVEDRDAFTFRGIMAADELEVFLGLVADILHAPQFNSYVHQDQRARAAMGRMSGSTGIQDGLRALTDHLFEGDVRFVSGSPRDYMAMSVVDVRRWMEEPMARGYVEATIVGDIAEAEVVQVMSRSLGALRPRAAVKTTTRPPEPVRMTAPAGFKRIEFVGEQNMGLVVGSWPITEPIHVRDQAALEVLAKVLEIRVRGELREELGLAYSPSAEFRSYDGFPNFAVMRAQIDCAPFDSQKVGPLVQSIGEALAKEGVTDGEFIGARGILKSQIKQAFRNNGFLTDILMRAQERPEELEEVAALHGQLMDTITLEEVNKWAALVLPASNCRAAAIVPKAFVGGFIP